MTEDRCICCGAIIPEGTMTCWQCEHKENKEKGDFTNEKDINCSRHAE